MVFLFTYRNFNEILYCSDGKHVVLQPQEKEIYDMKINVVCHALQFMVELAAAVSKYANESKIFDVFYSEIFIK